VGHRGFFKGTHRNISSLNLFFASNPRGEGHLFLVLFFPYPFFSCSFSCLPAPSPQLLLPRMRRIFFFGNCLLTPSVRAGPLQADQNPFQSLKFSGFLGFGDLPVWMGPSRLKDPTAPHPAFTFFKGPRPPPDLKTPPPPRSSVLRFGSRGPRGICFFPFSEFFSRAQGGRPLPALVTRLEEDPPDQEGLFFRGSARPLPLAIVPAVIFSSVSFFFFFFFLPPKSRACLRSCIASKPTGRSFSHLFFFSRRHFDKFFFPFFFF